MCHLYKYQLFHSTCVIENIHGHNGSPGLDCGAVVTLLMLLQEVAHGDHNIIQLAEAACPQPPPRAHQFCNVIDCPPAWQAEPWTKVWRQYY